MKQFLLVLLPLFFLGCAYYSPSSELIRTPDITFESMDVLQQYVRDNISYKNEFVDYWQAPQETLEKGTGDCEDFCIFSGYFADKLGYTVNIVAFETPNGNHMVLKLDNEYYEGQTLLQYKYAEKYPKISSMSLENALRICANRYGSREIQ
jgi:hypothetical protein